ncbi:MAG: phosphatidate cytidylyltransferase [Burkholderiaceae bacterium]
MLKTRVITALVLLAILLAVIFTKSFLVFAIVSAVFFAAAIWECFRLFDGKHPIVGALIWTGVFEFLILKNDFSGTALFFGLCVAIWVIRLIPSLAIGLPPLSSARNRLLNGIYGIAILGCFLAIAVLFTYSPLYLFSIMAIVWIADIGAYFSGKAFGKHKLAISISPGKSWEGAIGGWLAVLALSSVFTLIPLFNDTFSTHVFLKWGWFGLAAVMTLLVAASIVGDLFESQLKRRINMKDSSNLLPGHGGVLDRIDALIPALPLAVLIHLWL